LFAYLQVYLFMSACVKPYPLEKGEGFEIRVLNFVEKT